MGSGAGKGGLVQAGNGHTFFLVIHLSSIHLPFILPTNIYCAIGTGKKIVSKIVIVLALKQHTF